MPYCKECGSDIGNAAFCPNCGFKTAAANQAVPNNAGMYFQSPEQVLATLASKEEQSKTFWIIAIAFQVISVIILPIVFIWFIAFSFGNLAVMAWNIYTVTVRCKFITQIRMYPVGIYGAYETRLAPAVASLVINFLFGGIVGLIAAIYDLTVRSYAMSHKNELLYIENGILSAQYYNNLPHQNQ